ncbi:MAG: CoB--CoM heterodisulfide reductase iron-sulfur subunit B family protein [Deltaproteobacteria bacterium]|nr:CoB--CoM heterodisulfide reductase iron-sulfur subunit B family protein [Deltaproteobacteria bacterium]
MKIIYYPGCTLKTKAKNLGDTAVSAMNILGVELEELTRWNCCGAVYSLADDDLIHQVAPVRILVRAMEQGGGKLVTLCSMCYNTLARANLIMKNDEEKRNTINNFMDEEKDYNGEVEVVHLLSYLDNEVGWKAIKEKVKNPLTDLNIAPYYGCTLQRPREVGIEAPGSFQLMSELLETLGASAIRIKEADLCCGSYQIIANPDAAANNSAKIVKSAEIAGADALSMSCPLCEYNIGKKQAGLPTFYFTQLLAIALGVAPEECHFELNHKSSFELLKTKGIIK